jgi:hypothetical protein
MQSILRTKRTINSHHVSTRTTLPLRHVPHSIRMKTIDARPSIIISDWKRSSTILPFIQRRHYAEEARGTESVDQKDIDYFKNKCFSNEQIAQIIRTTKGVSFRVIPLPTDSEEILKATELFIHTFFKSVIQSHPDSSALGGEKVLLFHPSIPGMGKPDSSFLMAFDGEQDPHFHGGPRHLDMWSSKPWTVIVGGSDAQVLNDPKIQFTKIQFPAGHVSLSFRKGMFHGFAGEGIGAISTHWTDAEELAVASENAGKKNTNTDSKELMSTLTKFVSKEKIQIIGDQSIPWQSVAALQSSVTEVN